MHRFGNDEIGMSRLAFTALTQKSGKIEWFTGDGARPMLFGQVHVVNALMPCASIAEALVQAAVTAVAQAHPAGQIEIIFSVSSGRCLSAYVALGCGANRGQLDKPLFDFERSQAFFAGETIIGG
jgi:hypothetical protein